MLNRLYQNGMLTSGEPRHFTAWDFPNRPRLRLGDSTRNEVLPNNQTANPRHWPRRKLALLLDAIRAR